MNDMVVYNMTKELDQHSVDIMALNGRINNLQKTCGALIAITVIEAFVIAANLIELYLFEDKVNNHEI